MLYEISNEDTGGEAAKDWQYEMIRLIREVESEQKRARHPVGISAIGVKDVGWRNDWLSSSTADFIFPAHMPNEDFKEALPIATGHQVIMLDTDHIWGVGGNHDWVWKAFTRGYNVIYMDPFEIDGFPEGTVVDLTVRKAMGDTRFYADKVELAAMQPSLNATSTGYCLFTPDETYLVFNPDGEEIAIYNLPAGEYVYEWFNGQRETQETFKITHFKAGDFIAPTASESPSKVFYLKKAGKSQAH